MSETEYLDATTLAGEIRQRSITPSEAVAAAIEAIEQQNPHLLAFCTPTLDSALAEARALEDRIVRGENTGPLAGVPISIKDLIFTRGVRTTGGSVAYADFVPDEDDVVVERLRAAGAILLGKTNVAELGYSLTGDNPLFGTTRNPWDLSRTPGGSSAGAAVAVATGMGPVAIGSDGGGSIRVPAAWCGLFGFKPSMGRVPLHPGCRDERFPGLSGWESLEHIGPLTRTVADAALTLSVIAGPDGRDRHSVPDLPAGSWQVRPATLRGRRIGYCRSWGGAAIDPEIAAIVDRAVRVFENDLGCIVEEVELDWENPVLGFRTLIVLDSDLSAMRRMVEQYGDRMSPNIVRLMTMEWSAEAFTDALKMRKAFANRLWRLMSCYDFLATPTSHTLPPPAEKAAGAADIERPLPILTCVANMTGQPAASLPAGWTTDGLPVGLQLIGRHLADADLLGACASFEQASPWRTRWPPFSGGSDR